MAESLILGYDDYRSKVGEQLGYGRLVWDTARADERKTLWSADQEADIENAVQDGLREFYAPPRLQGMNHAHEWSFLWQRRIFTTTVNTVWEYNLPDEYAGYQGNLWISGSSAGHVPIPVVGEAMILEARSAAGNVSSGRPLHAAILNVAERQAKLIFYPTPDAAYTIEGMMRLTGAKLSKDNKYPYGGTHHSQTILEAMLATAERIHGDVDGIHRGAFYERLAASVQVDKKTSLGTHQEYVGDPGCPEDAYFRGRGGARLRLGTATYQNQSFVMQ
jgi:hypothetical protein